MDNHLLVDVKLAEGVKLTAYKDTKGFWTVGYGHFLDQSKDWTSYTITQIKANWYLESDLSEAATLCAELSEWRYLDTPCRQNAVIELVFNMGKEKWEDFTHTRRAIEAQNWQEAHDQLLDSEWAKEVGKTRSERLATYLLKGEY
jgi:lysozyme